jgi:hypothetical protein
VPTNALNLKRWGLEDGVWELRSASNSLDASPVWCQRSHNS